jgi:hypothetical protein
MFSTLQFKNNSTYSNKEKSKKTNANKKPENLQT